MTFLIRGGRLLDPKNGRDGRFDLLIEAGRVARVERSIPIEHHCKVLSAKGCWVFPGLIDAHVHLREPGGERSETILSGTKAAAKGGVTSLLAMANTRPPIDSPSKVSFLVQRSKRASSRVYPVGAITLGLEGKKLAPFSSMKKAGCVTFSDDGHCVMDEHLMEKALNAAKRLGVPLIEHCEDEGRTFSGVIHDGSVSRKLKVGGISSESEAKIVERDIRLAKKTGAHIHFAHISCKESITLIRKAKKKGVPVSAETCPHYFTLTDEAVFRFGSCAKMKPPLRTEADRLAIFKGLKDGTLDIIATDHAPHEDKLKAKGLLDSPFGIIGLETSFALVYNELVLKRIFSPIEAIRKMSEIPVKIFGIEGGHLGVGALADLVIFNPAREWRFLKEGVVSKSHNSPFLGRRFKGEIVLTMVGGKVVYEYDL